MNIFPNLIPTEEQIAAYAERLFPNDFEKQLSFTEGIWYTVANLIDESKKRESCRIQQQTESESLSTSEKERATIGTSSSKEASSTWKRIINSIRTSLR
jgi:hypothetical protein